MSLLKSTRIEKLERIEGSRTKHTRKKMINESSFFVKYIFALEKNVRTLSGDTPSPLYANLSDSSELGVTISHSNTEMHWILS